MADLPGECDDLRLRSSYYASQDLQWRDGVKVAVNGVPTVAGAAVL
jgi:hypothetical protein